MDRSTRFTGPMIMYSPINLVRHYSILLERPTVSRSNPASSHAKPKSVQNNVSTSRPYDAVSTIPHLMICTGTRYGLPVAPVFISDR